MRVGGGSIIRVDVRIVAATNESLEEKIQDGSFRKDLYYRLNALTVEIPPLRKGMIFFCCWIILCEKWAGILLCQKVLRHFTQASMAGKYQRTSECSRVF